MVSRERSVTHKVCHVGVRVRQEGAEQLCRTKVTAAEIREEERLVRDEEVESSCDLTLSHSRQERALIQRKRAE
jgi:hypothetical protein